ncbi:MAG: ATP-dependent endonuclease, partial [Pseudomonas sp. PGPPP3]
MVGPGDSGKSTILDAIDICLSARRSWSFSDSDFYNQDVTKRLHVRLTIGALPDALLDLDAYGDYLRSYDDELGFIDDEPKHGNETVLTLELGVEADLEPQWRLYSDRAEDSERRKSLAWKDRLALAPARLGSHSNSNLSWSRGSVLNRLSDGRVNVGTALVDAAREARVSFGEQAGETVSDVLDAVAETARELGINVGSEDGIPLRTLGVGSARLLLAGLHRRAAAHTSMLLADEIEYGLEPHRLIRLLHSMGAKDKNDALQVFMTTHSPVAIRELSGDQVYVVRRKARTHAVAKVGTEDAIQGALRTYPEAFLSRTVVVCEGASEIGLLRGIDLHRASKGEASAFAAACTFLDSSGGTPERTLQRAQIFRGLGFETIAFMDSDLNVDQDELEKTSNAGVQVFLWEEGHALEQAMFNGISDAAVNELLDLAVELNSEEDVDSSIMQVSEGSFTLESVRELFNRAGVYGGDIRKILGDAAKLSSKAKKGKPA